MKNLSWILILIALMIIGCGGGGGGDTTTSTTNTTATNGTTSGGPGVSGRIRAPNDGANEGLQGVILRFYNAARQQVATATTGANGQFRVELPSTATSFTIDLSQADPANNYFRQFGFGTQEYLANDTRCLAPLPTVSPGQPQPLPSDIVVMPRWMGPPPPPSGCLGG